MSTKPISNGPKRANHILILAHGAGQAADSSFMQCITKAIADNGVRVVRFNFPYMQVQIDTGKKKPPDRAPILIDYFKQVLHEVRASAPPRAKLFIGGKSMGGRIASLIADEETVSGLICLGYPFHPPGKPDKLRIKHLLDIKTRTLICQGERDPFGKPEEVKQYPVSKKIKIHWITDGEHSFKPRKSSGLTEQDNLLEAAHTISQFILGS